MANRGRPFRDRGFERNTSAELPPRSTESRREFSNSGPESNVRRHPPKGLKKMTDEIALWPELADKAGAHERS